MIRVYTTGRGVRKYIESCIKKRKQPQKAITIEQLFERAVIAKGKFIDKEIKLALLKDVCSEKDLKELGFKSGFGAFLENAQSILSFLEESSLEMVDLDEFLKHDPYSEYKSHINILKEIKNRYEKLLEKNGYVDKITLPKKYSINKNYIMSLEEIHIFYSGILSRFEMNILRKIAEISKTYIYFDASEYSEKLCERIGEGIGDLECGYSYKIDLSSKKIIEKNRLELNYNIEAASFSMPIFQIAYIKKKISDFVKMGISPDRIGVILPDDSLVSLLRAYNDKHNLNFAMGIPFKEGKIYESLKAVLDYTYEKSAKNISKIERLSKENSKFDEIFKETIHHWSDSRDFSENLLILAKYAIFSNRTDEGQKYEDALYRFSMFGKDLSNLSLSELFPLFLHSLNDISLDDTKGGRITVMNVLETRGVSFDAVIIPNFNEGKAPSENSKDLFLSSEIKRASGMPDSKDRENLQKHYYAMLLGKAKVAAVSFVEDAENSPSRFLKSFPAYKTESPEYSYAAILHKITDKKYEGFKGEISGEFDLAENPVSATKLKTYLSCKRRFYYRYILRLEEKEIPSLLSKKEEVGKIMHGALQAVYTKKRRYLNEDELYNAIKDELEKIATENIYLKFNIDLFAKKLKRFVKVEVDRFKKGYKVVEVEKELRCMHNGIELYGVIDRIDMAPDGTYEILDFKTGKYTLYTQRSVSNAKDFQLEFYHILGSKNGYGPNSVYFYDLNESKLVKEQSLEAKLALLDGVLEKYKQKEQNFEMTATKNECIFCPYATMCHG